MKDLESYGKSLEENARFFAGIELTMLFTSFLKYKELFSLYQSSSPGIQFCLKAVYLMIWATTPLFLLSMSHVSISQKIIKLIDTKGSSDDILEEYRNSVWIAQYIFKTACFGFYITIVGLGFFVLIGLIK